MGVWEQLPPPHRGRVLENVEKNLMFVSENDAIWVQFFLSSFCSTPPLQLSRAMQRPYFRPFLFRPSCNNNNTQQQQQQFNPTHVKDCFCLRFRLPAIGINTV